MKKLRLFTSIFVVCISLAVICFGVFAATQVSYNVGGTISYEVNDCFLDVNTNVYKYTNGLISQEDAQKMFVKCKTFEKVENASFSFKTYDATSGAFDDLENVQQKLDLKFEKCYAFFIVVSVKAYNKDKNITVDVTSNFSNTEHIWCYTPKQYCITNSEGTKDIIIAMGLSDSYNTLSYTYDFGLSFNLASKDSFVQTGTLNMNVANGNYRFDQQYNTISQVNDITTINNTVQKESMDEFSDLGLKLAYVNFNISNFADSLTARMNIVDAKLDNKENDNLQYISIKNANVASIADINTLASSGKITPNDISTTPKAITTKIATSGETKCAMVVGVPTSIEFNELTFDTMIEISETIEQKVELPYDYKYGIAITPNDKIIAGIHPGKEKQKVFDTYNLSSELSYSVFEPKGDYFEIEVDISKGSEFCYEYADNPALFFQAYRLANFYQSNGFLPIPADSYQLTINNVTYDVSKSNWNDYIDKYDSLTDEQKAYVKENSMEFDASSTSVVIPFATSIDLSKIDTSSNDWFTVAIMYTFLTPHANSLDIPTLTGTGASIIQGQLCTYTDFLYNIVTTQTDIPDVFKNLGVTKTSSWGALFKAVVTYVNQNGASSLNSEFNNYSEINGTAKFTVKFLIPGNDYTIDFLTGLSFPETYSTNVMNINGDMNKININLWNAKKIISNDSSAIVDGNLLVNSQTKELIRYANLSENNEYTLPSTIKKVGYGAFYNCKNLGTLNIPNETITSFDKNALTETKIGKINLHSAYIQNNNSDSFKSVIKFSDIQDIGAYGKTALTWNEIEDFNFSTKKNVTVTYSDNLSKLTFEQTANGYLVSGQTDKTLTDIVVPETYNNQNVIGIKENAFLDNNTLIKLVLPNTIKTIGDNALKGCTSIKTLELNNIELNSFGVNNLLSSMVIVTKNQTTLNLIKSSYTNAIDVDLDFQIARGQSGQYGGSGGDGMGNVEYVLTVDGVPYTFSHSFYETLSYTGHVLFNPTSQSDINVKLDASLSANNTESMGNIDHIQEQIALQRTSDNTKLFGTATDETYYNHSGASASVNYETRDGQKANVGDSLKLIIKFEIMENVQCFTGETLVTLADGSTKQIKDVTYDDLLMVYDFDRGEFSVSYPIWIAKVGEYNHYYKMTFSDNSYVNIVLSHRLFTLTDMDFEKSIDATYSNIGKEFVKQVIDENGKPKFISVTCTNIERIDETVKYYNMVTAQSFNFFSNGFLGATGIANLYHFEKDSNGNIVHNKTELERCKSGTTDWKTGTQFAYDVYDKSKITEEVYVAYRLSEIRNMADCWINDPSSPYYAIAQKYGKDVVYNKAIQVVNEYFKDGYIESLRSTNEKLKITMSDRTLDKTVKYKDMFTLPEANNSENFVGWYNTYDGKIYQAGESAEIHMNTHFIARYSK